MAYRDRGVRADYVDRAFRKEEDRIRDMPRHPNQRSPFVNYQPRTKDPKAGLDAYERPEVTLQRDLAKLAAMRASLPKKPPGRR